MKHTLYNFTYRKRTTTDIPEVLVRKSCGFYVIKNTLFIARPEDFNTKTHLTKEILRVTKKR